MNTDSVFILNQTKIPDTMQVIVNNLPDSLAINGVVKVSNMTKPNNYESRLDSLVAIGRDISEFGIGYSDTISNIAFPLIIAVFAFLASTAPDKLFTPCSAASITVLAVVAYSARPLPNPSTSTMPD